MDTEKTKEFKRNIIGGVGGGAAIAITSLPFDLYTLPLKGSPAELKARYGIVEGQKRFGRLYAKARLRELFKEKQWRTGLRTIKWDVMRKMLGWGVGLSTAGLIATALKEKDTHLINKKASISAIAVLFENSRK